MVLKPNGLVYADPLTGQTSVEDIFAGGDILSGPKFAIDAIASGYEGAESLHRFVHENASLTIGRNKREFVSIDTNNILLPPESFNKPKRQKPAPVKGEHPFDEIRKVMTPEQVIKETSRCLGCGTSIVDENQCIGCGICTTKCAFDAIHLSRDIPEASVMVRSEDKMKRILPYAAKRALKIIRKGKDRA